jgi:hypothetical protein
LITFGILKYDFWISKNVKKLDHNFCNKKCDIIYPVTAFSIKMAYFKGYFSELIDFYNFRKVFYAILVFLSI